MQKLFNEEYADSIRTAQESLVKEITEFINSGIDVATKIAKRADEYSAALQHMQNVYYSSGFPFAFVIRTYKNSPWSQYVLQAYPQLYKNALKEAIRDLDGLYVKGVCLPHTPRMRKVFDLLDKKTSSYDELLGLLLTGNKTAEQAVKALFPIKYDTNNFISPTLTKPQDIEEFLQDFMPRYAEIRNNRNKIIHPNMTPEEIELALKKVRECLDMLRPNKSSI